MRYSNIDYTVLYVDPSKSTNGTGATPATAMNTLPASIGSIADRTCYLIRRTAEAKALVLPSGTNSNVTALMFLGMPMPPNMQTSRRRAQAARSSFRMRSSLQCTASTSAGMAWTQARTSCV